MSFMLLAHLVRSGDARILGELIDVAVRGAEVDPGVPTFVDSGLIEDLHTGGPQLRGRGLDVVDQEPGDRAGGEVAVDFTVGAEDLDLAPIGELQAVDAALDHVALPVSAAVEAGRPARPATLVDAGRDGVGDAAAAQQPPARLVAVATVGQQVLGPLARSTASVWPGHPDGVQQRLELGS